MILYADILFLINLGMDWFSLFLCGKIVGTHIPRFRGLFGALLGALFGVAAALCELSFIMTELTALITAFIITLAAFGKMPFITWCKRTALFYITSAFLGGVTSALSYMWRIAPSFAHRPLQTSALYIGTVGSVFCLIRLIKRAVCRFTYRKAVTCNITYGGKTYRLTLLVDSGNLLTDPYTDRPVVVLSEASSKRIFGDISPEKLPPSERIQYAWHYIPYRTATGDSVSAVCKVDSFIINGKNLSVVLAPSKQSMAGLDGIIGEACLTDFHTTKEEQHEHLKKDSEVAERTAYR